MFLREQEIMHAEIWTDIPGYEGIYQASDLGRVRSLDRITLTSDNKLVPKPGSFLKATINKKGYPICRLYKNGKLKDFPIHQLIARTFLGHISDGTVTRVVDHINDDKLDNRLTNLRIVTNRENVAKNKKSRSGFTGVSQHGRLKTWRARIYINGKPDHIGVFATPEEASVAYQKALAELNKSYGIS